MSMTKKDYVAIAEVMNEIVWAKDMDPVTTTATVIKLSTLFSSDNANFQHDTFIKACLAVRKDINV